MKQNQDIWLNSYDQWVPPTIDVPPVTLNQMVAKAAEDFGSRPAVHFFDATWTFGQLLEMADSFARALHHHGLRQGGCLAIHMFNSPQYLIALYGALKAGVVVSGLSPLLTSGELAFQLKDLGTKAVISLDNLFAERLAGVVHEIDSLELVIVTGLMELVPGAEPAPAQFDQVGTKVKGLGEMLSLQYDPLLEFTVSPDDVCFIQYTGGTTGAPKGAMLTHRNAMANQTQIGAWLDLRGEPEIILFAYPMFHVAGLFHAIQCLLFGITQIVIPNPRDLDYLIDRMSHFQPSIIGYVPTLYLNLLEKSEFKTLDFSNLKFACCGAAPYPENKVQELEAVIGKGRLLELYGLTESNALLTANPLGGVKKVGSIGLPLPATRLKLMGPNGRTEVSQGQEGEIMARGPQIMKGYFKQPQETKQAIREYDGNLWFYTGDIARMDEDGYLFIVDRAKDMINVGGYKVFSSEVEHKLSRHPAIGLCAIVGVINPERPGSELVKLFVEKSDAYREQDEDSLGEDIIKFARETLAPYKVPKIVEFIDALPLTSVGKLNKKALRQAD